jgi:branched-chain amino acid transport system substrate-binding protein
VYTSGAPDLSDTILKIKSVDPDVLFAVANTPDAILLTRQMQSLNYWPKMGMINPGGGMADPAYASDLGELSQGVVFSEAWSPLLNIGQGNEINAKFEAQYGYPLAGATATSYVTTHLLAAALEKSCSRDPKALAEVLRTESFPEGVWSFMYPSGIKFDEKGYVIDPLVVVIQLQDGKPVPVWPADLAQGEVIWPVPGWNER